MLLFILQVEVERAGSMVAVGVLVMVRQVNLVGVY